MDNSPKNNYICNYPQDQNIYNILTTNEIIKNYPIGYEEENNLEHIFYYNIGRCGDLVKSLNISTNGKIKEIIITIGGNTVYTKHDINKTNIGITPFIFGIPLTSLKNSGVEIFIITDNNHCELFVDYLFLHKNERDIIQNKLEFNNGVTIENGFWSQKTYLKQKFIKHILTNNEYKCNYPCKVDDIIAPEIIQRCITYCKNDIYSYDIIDTAGDIIKNIIIKKDDDLEYKYSISIGTVFYESPTYYDKGNTFTPFEYGIPMYALHCTKIIIKIQTKSKIRLFIKSLLINDKENMEFIMPVKENLIKINHGICYYY